MLNWQCAMRRRIRSIPTVFAEVDLIVLHNIIAPFFAGQLWEWRIEYFIPHRAYQGEARRKAEPGQSLIRIGDNEPKVARVKEHRRTTIILVYFASVEHLIGIAIILFHIANRFGN